MHRQAEIQWKQPKCKGDLPSKRSGHTFTKVNSFAYLFGGCSSGSKGEGKAGPTNDLYKLDLGSDVDFHWTKLGINGIKPISRWRHTATQISDNRILVFGGFTSSKPQKHLNDMWIFDTSNETWLTAEGNENHQYNKPRVSRWSNLPVRDVPPCPRGSHTATFFDDHLLIFGGNGGSGYIRKDFNDLYALDLHDWKWYEVQTTGERPSPRSGHQTVLAENKLIVLGGWSVSEQFDDVHVLDMHRYSWSKPKLACGPENWGLCRWNFTAVSAFAVPHWKVFIFGGNSGNLEEKPQGMYRSDVQVLEYGVKHGCINSTFYWTQPHVVGEVHPSPRAETEMLYCSNLGKLVVFGGWSDRWHHDFYTCQVKNVVGPPYNVLGLKVQNWESSIGPVTGGSELILRGKGFKVNKLNSATIRFSCQKGFCEVNGKVESDEEISLVTPNFEKYGPIEADVRVKLGALEFSNAMIFFKYFAVTDSSTTVAFGPGILKGNSINTVTSFVVQAKDKASNNRICGMDEFRVLVSKIPRNQNKGKDLLELAEGGTKIQSFIKDQGDGTYIVEYTPQSCGAYVIQIDFLGTFAGCAGPIRGSPFFVDVVKDAPEHSNQFDGQNFIQHTMTTIKLFSDFAPACVTALTKVISPDDFNSLMSLKEQIRKIEENANDFEITAASNRAALKYLKEKGQEITSYDTLVEDLETALDTWEEAKKEIPNATELISLTDKIWAEKIKFRVEAYEKELTGKLEDQRKLPFWHYVDRSNGEKVVREVAMTQIQEAEKLIRSEMLTLNENANLCQIFKLEDQINTSRSVIEEMQTDLHEMIKLWEVIEKIEEFMQSAEQLPWKTFSIEKLEKGLKNQIGLLSGLHTCVEWCDAFKSVKKKCEDMLNSISIVDLLRSNNVQPRHWKLIFEAAGVADDDNFIFSQENETVQLKRLLALNLQRMMNRMVDIIHLTDEEEIIENTLEQMKIRWSEVTFTNTPYKITGTEEEVSIISIRQEDIQKLENDKEAIRSMLKSQFLTKELHKDVMSWHEDFLSMSESYELLSYIQQLWTHLEPLYRAEELKSELPDHVTSEFFSHEKTLRNITQEAWKQQSIRTAILGQDGEIKSILEHLKEQLDVCKKNLNDFVGERSQG